MKGGSGPGNDKHSQKGKITFAIVNTRPECRTNHIKKNSISLSPLDLSLFEIITYSEY